MPVTVLGQQVLYMDRKIWFSGQTYLYFWDFVKNKKQNAHIYGHSNTHDQGAG